MILVVIAREVYRFDFLRRTQNLKKFLLLKFNVTWKVQILIKRKSTFQPITKINLFWFENRKVCANSRQLKNFNLRLLKRFQDSLYLTLFTFNFFFNVFQNLWVIFRLPTNYPNDLALTYLMIT